MKKSFWQISKKRLFEDGLVFGLIIGFVANIAADRFEDYRKNKDKNAINKS